MSEFTPMDMDLDAYDEIEQHTPDERQASQTKPQVVMPETSDRRMDVQENPFQDRGERRTSSDKPPASGDDLAFIGDDETLSLAHLVSKNPVLFATILGYDKDENGMTDFMREAETGNLREVQRWLTLKFPLEPLTKDEAAIEDEDEHKADDQDSCTAIRAYMENLPKEKLGGRIERNMPVGGNRRRSLLRRSTRGQDANQLPLIAEHVRQENELRALVWHLDEHLISRRNFRAMSYELATNFKAYLKLLKEKQAGRSVAKGISKILEYFQDNDQIPYLWNPDTAEILVTKLCDFLTELKSDSGGMKQITAVNVGDVVTAALKFAKGMGMEREIRRVYDEVGEFVLHDFGLQSAHKNAWKALLSCDDRHCQQFVRPNLALAAVRCRRVYLIVYGMRSISRCNEPSRRLPENHLIAMVLLISRSGGISAVAANQCDDACPGGGEFMECIMIELALTGDEELKKFGCSVIYREITRNMALLLDTSQGRQMIWTQYELCGPREQSEMAESLFNKFCPKLSGGHVLLEKHQLWRDVAQSSEKSHLQLTHCTVRKMKYLLSRVAEQDREGRF